MSLYTLAASPFRSPDWRWQRAVALVDRPEETRPASRFRDGASSYKWIHAATRFLREYNLAERQNEFAILAEKHPSIFWAYNIWLSDNPTKTIVEAHILARSDDRYIAFRCNTTPDVIHAYEAMFFNVREKLHHRSYILNSVIGAEIHNGLSEREYGLLWKLYGYFLGPHIVDAMEAKFVNPIWCNSPADLNAAVMDDAINTLKFKAAVAAKTVPVNQYTQLAILEAFTKFIEIERNTDSAGKAQDQILAHISAMMGTLPFNVGGRTTTGALAARGAPGEQYEDSAIELTYEETLRLAMSKPIAHEDILAKLQFPPLPTETVSVTQGGDQ